MCDAWQGMVAVRPSAKSHRWCTERDITALLAYYAPKIFKHYCDTLLRLRKEYPTMKTATPNSVFPAMSFNFGPHAATVEHTDHQNYAGGLCVVTAMGQFNPSQTGHLYLKELNLVVEFPPGASILLPSALMRHGNTALARGDVRCSATQYAAGGLFRFPEQGFVRQKSMGAEAWKAFKTAEPAHAAAALERFSKGSELHTDHEVIFGKVSVGSVVADVGSEHGDM